MIGEIATDEELLRFYGKDEINETKPHEKLLEKVKKTTACSSSKCNKAVKSVFPFLDWLPKYRIKKDLPGDLIGGLTVGIVHIPQGLAYSLLAGLPPINGLYVSFFPVLIYALLGTTRQLSIGTFAVISLMVAAVIDKNTDISCLSSLQHSDGGSILSYSGENWTTAATTNITSIITKSTTISCQKAIESRKIELAVGLSISVAIIHLAMYVFRLGVLTIYFSSHMVSGYTCGAAFHVLTSQISKLLGLDVPRRSGILSLVYTYIDIFSSLHLINWQTVIVSLCCIVLLFIGKFINEKFKKKLPFPLPWELLLVILSTITSSYGNLNDVGVNIVGEIPQGIETSIPQPKDIELVILDAIPIAIVIYSVSISLSRLLSEKHGYEINSNQELLAYAAANVFGAFFQCFPSASSMSRSIIWDETGGNTQITGLLSAVVVLIVLLWIGPLFEPLPQATLASIIVVNLKRLLLQFRMLKPLWKVSKLDAVTWFVSWLAVILLGVDYGLYVGVGFSLLTVVLRTQLISGNSLVPLGNTQLYKSSKDFKGNTPQSYVLFSFPGPLIYINQERFKNHLFRALGFKPALELAKLQKTKNVTKNEISSPSDSFPDPEMNRFNQSYEDETNESGRISNEVTLHSPDFPKNSSNDNEAQKERKQNFFNLRSSNLFPKKVILEMSQCSFIDNDGVKTLKSIFNELSKLDIRLLLANCPVDIRKSLITGSFPEQSADECPVFFVSLSKAIAHQVGENLSALTNGVSITMEENRQPEGESTRL